LNVEVMSWLNPHDASQPKKFSKSIQTPIYYSAAITYLASSSTTHNHHRNDCKQPQQTTVSFFFFLSIPFLQLDYYIQHKDDEGPHHTPPSPNTSQATPTHQDSASCSSNIIIIIIIISRATYTTIAKPQPKSPRHVGTARTATAAVRDGPVKETGAGE